MAFTQVYLGLAEASDTSDASPVTRTRGEAKRLAKKKAAEEMKQKDLTKFQEAKRKAEERKAELKIQQAEANRQLRETIALKEPFNQRSRSVWAGPNLGVCDVCRERQQRIFGHRRLLHFGPNKTRRIENIGCPCQIAFPSHPLLSLRRFIDVLSDSVLFFELVRPEVFGIAA